MAKQQQSKEEAKTVATTPSGSGAMVPYDYGNMAGRGFENIRQEDVGIPFLNLLQTNSPQCTDGDQQQLPGARAGMFMDSLSKQLWDGEKGVVVVPCATQHVFVEWVPRINGGGFVGVHAYDSEVVLKATGGKRTMGKLKMPTCEQGKPYNDLIETYYIFALVLASADATEPLGAYVISMTSTKIKHYRAAIGDLRKWRAGVPLFAHRLLVTSFNDKNKAGQPFKNMKLVPVNGSIERSLIPPSLGDQKHPLLLLGEQLLTSIEGGTAKVAHESNAREGGGEDEAADTVFSN